MRLRTWVWAFVGLATVLIVGLVALVGAGFYFMSRQIDIDPAGPDAARSEFEEVRKRFEGREPLLEAFGDELIVRTGPTTGLEPRPPIETIHVMVWDPDEKRVFRLRIPFWLVRLTGRQSIKLSSDDSGFRAHDVELSVDDLERFGPGLILDHTEPDGARVLVWAD